MHARGSLRVICLAFSSLAAAVLLAGAPPKVSTTEEIVIARANAARDSWWAYTVLVKPALPAVDDRAWCRNEIDAFVLAPMEAKGLIPAVEADRIALIRRASFDLTGLPPLLEEIDAFVADSAPDAFERVIDRLLASPHYGEKWARHWLDLVRYADTNGFERDSDKEAAWKYRDFVVRAFNDDMPYASFVRAQLAGDEIPDRTFDSLVATGFYRLGLWDDEVPDLAQTLADDRDGIVDTTARTFLGMSLGCARCHDHKGDPIRQKEYYEFSAWFAGVAPYKESAGNGIEAENVLRMVRRDFGIADPEVDIAAYHSKRATIVEALRAFETPSNSSAIEASRAFADVAPSEGLVTHLAFEDAKNATAVNAVSSGKSATIRDAGFAAEGRIGNAFHFDGGDDRVEIERMIGDDFTISFFFRTTDLGGGSDTDRRWFRGEGLVDGEVSGITRDFGVSHIAHGYIAAGTGDPETFISSGPGHNDGKWHHVAFTRDRSSGDIQLCIDGAVVDRARGSTEGLTKPRTISIGGMLPGYGAFTGDIDEVRFYDRVLSEETLLEMAYGLAPRTATHDLIEARDGADAAKHYDELRAQLAVIRPPDFKGETVLSVRELPQPNVTQVMARGSPHALGEVVQPNVPLIAARCAPMEVVKPSHGESSGRRLALANWITDPRNALAWRTMANRVWQHHFNAAIAPTPNDFGRLGEPATNPALLDFLASTLLEHDGSVKQLHRLIMSSAAYRMSSVGNAAALAKDAPNDLLTRFRMRRVSAEELRDSMLVANGTLNRETGGAPVLPPLPDEVLATSSRPTEVWPLTSRESWTRRSLYIKLKRSIQHPLLTAFDLADLDNPCPQRFATVVPTQSLSMLNGDLTNELSAQLARRVEQACPNDPRAQVILARRLTSGRVPAMSEVDEALAFMSDLQATESLTPSQALDSVCLVLFNLNEFLYID